MQDFVMIEEGRASYGPTFRIFQGALPLARRGQKSLSS